MQISRGASLKLLTAALCDNRADHGSATDSVRVLCSFADCLVCCAVVVQEYRRSWLTVSPVVAFVRANSGSAISNSIWDLMTEICALAGTTRQAKAGQSIS